MKKTLSLALLVTLILGSLSTPALAKAPKSDARAAAIAAALTAVSPDPMGGQIGLTVATARLSERGPTSQTSAALQPSADPSRRAYANWKSSTR